MIDTKLTETLIGRKTELDGFIKVYRQLKDEARANIERCKCELRFYELSAWMEIEQNVVSRLAELTDEYNEIVAKL